MEMSEWIQNFLARLGIEAGPEVTPEDAMELIEPLAKKLATEAVDDAIAASMLFVDEREWAIDYAADMPLGFQMFLEKRGSVKTQIALLARIKNAPSASSEMTQLDKTIARQVGVSEETFLRYNSPDNSAARSMTAVEREMAAKVGIKPEIFVKYNRPAVD